MYLQSHGEEKPVYKPALERWNQYKSIWINHWPEFEKIYPSRFEKLYGPLDEEKVDEVRKLVQCGVFKNGFQRHICPDCGLTLIVPFTCKSRLRISCARKSLLIWSFNLSCKIKFISKKSGVCHDCLKYMVKDTVYSFLANNSLKMLIKTHSIIGGVEANLHVLCGFDIRASVPVIF